MNDQPDLHILLKKRYEGTAWALCFEVPDGTSSNKRRTIDALSMGCWKSEGIHLHGHEIKHSRNDWLKELDTINKQDTWMPYLHKFWMVAVKGIIKPAELPAEWGLMENRGKGLKVTKAASLLKPLDIPHTMLAAIMRRMLLTPASKQELEMEHKRGYMDGKKAGDLSSTYEARIAGAERRAKRAEDKISNFENTSGIRISGWSHGDVGKQFKAFQELQGGSWDKCVSAAKAFVLAAETCGTSEEQ